MSEKYELKKEKTPEEIHNAALNKLDELRKLDEQNPMERAEKYDAVKKNPPEPGFMKVNLFEKTTPEGEPYIESKSKDETIQHDPFFTIDLNTAIMANVAACPSNVIPMLIDQSQRLAVDKMKTFKAEKRNTEFNWWWILFILLIIVPLIPLIFFFM